MALELMYITNCPEIAKIVEKSGVERVFIDLETLGKEERQKNMNTVKSHHTVQDVAAVCKVLTTSECMVRIDPWHEHSPVQVEAVIAAGANRIMLPMWKSAAEVKAFFNCVGGRTKTTLLLETREAAECLDEVLTLPGLDEIHIGLNDLHLSYGLTFMFQLLSDGTVEKLCKKMQNAGIAYGFGGIARIGEGMLPADRIVLEHYRLGSTRAILARAFCNTELVTDEEEIARVFGENVAKLREYEAQIDMNDTARFKENIKCVKECVEQIVERILNK